MTPIKTQASVDPAVLAELPLSVTLTMSLRDWRQLIAQLPPGQYPNWKVASAIVNAVRRIDNATRTAFEEELE